MGCSGRSDGAGRKLRELRIVPELLGSKEVDAVHGKAGGSQGQIERKLHAVPIEILQSPFETFKATRSRPPPRVQLKATGSDHQPKDLTHNRQHLLQLRVVQSPEGMGASAPGAPVVGLHLERLQSLHGLDDCFTGGTLPSQQPVVLAAITAHS